MQLLTATTVSGGSLVFDPAEFIGKFTKDGGRIVAMDFSSQTTLEGYLVRRGNQIVWERMGLEIYDTDPTTKEP